MEEKIINILKTISSEVKDVKSAQYEMKDDIKNIKEEQHVIKEDIKNIKERQDTHSCRYHPCHKAS